MSRSRASEPSRLSPLTAPRNLGRSLAVIAFILRLAGAA